MVGYYNTLPFLYGLKKSGDFDLILDIPSKCMGYYANGDVDIALVPVATLMDRSDYKIITDYCIGCEGEVRTVCLFSNSKIEKITKIYLDRDSRTSQLLVKTLCERSWNIQPVFEECDVKKIIPENLKEGQGILMIGDKVFEVENAFRNTFDLGLEWKKMTDLPFSFAVWIARKELEESVIDHLNEVLGVGVKNIDAVLSENKKVASRIDLLEYFKKYIDYHFTGDKKSALKLFFEFNEKVAKV
jgi:chorismate dehydratase